MSNDKENHTKRQAQQQYIYNQARDGKELGQDYDYTDVEVEAELPTVIASPQPQYEPQPQRRPQQTAAPNRNKVIAMDTARRNRAEPQPQPQYEPQQPPPTAPQPQRRNTRPQPPAQTAAPQPQTATEAAVAPQPQYEPQPQLPDYGYNYVGLLSELERSKPVIGRPPADGEEGGSLSNLAAWGSWFGRKAVLNPVNRVFDLFEDYAPATQTPEYMSWAKKQMYRFGGALIWAWSAFLTQAVTSLIFPEVDKVTKEAESFFKAGWFGFLNISFKAFITSLIFTLMLSFIETMIYDRNKSPLKKCLILISFVVDVAINAVGWAELWNHSKRFEWNPFITLLDAKNPRVEWGSLLCEVGAVLNAAMPEMLWQKGRNAVTRRKQNTSRSSSQQQTAQSQQQAQERGMWLHDAQGKPIWVGETQLRKLAAEQHRQVAGTGRGRGK